MVVRIPSRDYRAAEDLANFGRIVLLAGAVCARPYEGGLDVLYERKFEIRASARGMRPMGSVFEGDGLGGDLLCNGRFSFRGG